MLPHFCLFSNIKYSYRQYLDCIYAASKKTMNSCRTNDYNLKCWVISTQLWVKYGQTQPLG